MMQRAVPAASAAATTSAAMWRRVLMCPYRCPYRRVRMLFPACRRNPLSRPDNDLAVASILCHGDLPLRVGRL